MAEAPIRLSEPERKNGPAQGRRMVTLSLTVPKLIFSIVSMLGILIWVFIFGIMLGRGHNPEKVVPELARVMPSPQPKNATAARAANATAQPGSQAVAQAGASAAPATGVLTPQDLQYHDTLKGKPTASPIPAKTPPKPAVPPKQPPKAKAEQKPDPKSAAPKQDTKTPATAKVDPKTAKPDAKSTAKADGKTPSATAKPAEKPAEKPAKNAGEPVFNYVYQVAAFKDTPSAEAMRKKLQAAGIATRVEKSKEGDTTWYKLLTTFKGRPEDTRPLRQTLANQGIPRVILRSKVPAQ